jgi:hypothetical protein
MKKNLSRLFFLLVLLFQLPELAVATCTIPGTGNNCQDLVSELPWLFKIHVKEEKPIRIVYLSSPEKLKSTPKLKIILDIGEYKNNESATEDFSKIYEKAHPDMGLSYGWDLILVLDKRTYHLHADCTLAEKYFILMANTLKHIVDPFAKNPPQSFLCRCGDGCKLSD